MKKITDLIKERRVYFDGGTGTVLQSMGLPAGQAPELWNITEPDRIISLHNMYFDAGANIVSHVQERLQKDVRMPMLPLIWDRPDSFLSLSDL